MLSLLLFVDPSSAELPSELAKTSGPTAAAATASSGIIVTEIGGCLAGGGGGVAQKPPSLSCSQILCHFQCSIIDSGRSI